MEIRELIPQSRSEDVERVVPAYLAIWNHPDNRAFLSLTGQPFDADQLRDWCGRHLASGVRYFGAFGSGRDPLGLLVTCANRLAGFELLGLGVDPEHKRRGVGTQLLQRGLEEARAEGYRAVDGKVYATNAAMLCLLIARGFVPVRMEYHRGPGGEDLVHLKKYL